MDLVDFRPPKTLSAAVLYFASLIVGARLQTEGSAARWRELVDSGKRRIVGLNCYAGGEEPEPEIFEVSDEVEQIDIERVRELRANAR